MKLVKFPGGYLNPMHLVSIDPYQIGERDERDGFSITLTDGERQFYSRSPSAGDRQDLRKQYEDLVSSVDRCLNETEWPTA